MRGIRRIASLTVLAGVLWAAPARAWMWCEHRDIAVTAIEGLPPAERAQLEALWASLKKEAGPQLCPTLVNPGAAPRSAFGDWSGICLDFPSYPAMGGDHSCSTAELRAVTEHEEWGRRVTWVAEWSKQRFAEAPNQAARIDAWNKSHLAMQFVDPRYLTRASSNNAHFLAPREPVAAEETLEVYVKRVLAPDAAISATAVYVQYHAIALRLAAQWRVAPEAARPDLARRALLAEGIALHFLEDSFSAGHYAATWGDSAWQKGTHDLYCVQGLTSKTWGGDLFAGHGDAHMTDHDQEVAGAVVGRSLAQLAGAASGTVAVSSRTFHQGGARDRGPRLLQGAEPAGDGARPGRVSRPRWSPSRHRPSPPGTRTTSIPRAPARTSASSGASSPASAPARPGAGSTPARAGASGASSRSAPASATGSRACSRRPWTASSGPRRPSSPIRCSSTHPARAARAGLAATRRFRGSRPAPP